MLRSSLEPANLQMLQDRRRRFDESRPRLGGVHSLHKPCDQGIVRLAARSLRKRDGALQWSVWRQPSHPCSTVTVGCQFGVRIASA